MVVAIGILRQLGGKPCFELARTVLAGSNTTTCSQVLTLTGKLGPSPTVFATEASTSRQVHATEAAAVAPQPEESFSISTKGKLKRAPTAYQIYLRQHHEEMKKKAPDMSFSERSRASNWKHLTKAEKDKYLAIAEKAARAFVPANEQASKKKEKKSTRAPSPVASYIKENYQLGKRRYPDLTAKALLGRMAADFKNLSEAEKAKFRAL